MNKYGYHDPRNSLVPLGDGLVTFGDGGVVVIAGPCAAESEEQVWACAATAAQAGASVLRGDAFKARTSHRSFQGHGEQALIWLREASNHYGLAFVTEVMSVEQIPLISRYADLLKVGSRNMQNFELLRALAEQDMPVLLKRGLMALIEEWLEAAEYILQGGRAKVVLCERGIRTPSEGTRNTFDLSAIPVIKHRSVLPVIADPSHAVGHKHLVIPMALASIPAGTDGVMFDIHPDPAVALCDGPQALLLEEVGPLVQTMEQLAQVMGRQISSPAGVLAA